jgi:predicted Zn-dependent peptidase
MIINLKSKTNFSGFYIVFDGSTNIEEEGLRGSSHLLEHLLCRQFKEMRTDLQSSGIDWNATTSNNHIRFYFTGLEEELKKFRTKLTNKILNFDVTKKDFESERKIVLQEYASTFSNQNKKHFLNVLRKYFNSAAPIGIREDLENLKWLDMIRLWETHYIKPSKIINVSKGFKFEDSTIDFNTEGLNKEWQLGEYNLKLEKGVEDKNQSSIIIFSDLISDDINVLKFYSKMLSSGLEAPLYKIAREKKELCYSIDSDVMSLNKKASLMISTKCEKKNEKELIKTVLDILNNGKKQLTKERFEIIKKSLIIQEKKREIERYANVDDKIEGIENSIFHKLDEIKYEQINKMNEKVTKTIKVTTNNSI